MISCSEGTQFDWRLPTVVDVTCTGSGLVLVLLRVDAIEVLLRITVVLHA